MFTLAAGTELIAMKAQLSAAFIVGSFVFLLKMFRGVETSKQILLTSNSALTDLRNRALTDHQKEIALRGYATRLFVLFLSITTAAVASLLIPCIGVFALSRFGLLKTVDVINAMTSKAFLITSSTVMALALLGTRLFRRSKNEAKGSRRSGQPSSFENRYTPIDRLLHQVAFASNVAQLSLCDLEDHLFRRQLESIKAERPVFVTGLPRAGTTLLLDLLVKTGEFASHTYRNMPFVFLPLLWNQMFKTFRRTSPLQERAHGDGMLINVDSPEAFEEVLWKAFWRSHYKLDRIRPWSPGEDSQEFAEFLTRHICKVIASRRDTFPAAHRYVSKNNLNIARVEFLRRTFPDSVVILPFRDPIQHGLSLLRQHKNFSAIHAVDPFARRYMADIGHFDFGANLRPVDFSSWLASRTFSDPMTLGFWLEYWCACYQHLLRFADTSGISFISYDELCRQPTKALRILSGISGISDGGALQSQHSSIREERAREADVAALPEELLERARDCHRLLKQQSIV